MQSLSAWVSRTENSSTAAPIWIMSGRVCSTTRAISAGSADSDSATRFAPGGNAAKIARARSVESSRGNAPSPTSTPMWSTPKRASATASSGVCNFVNLHDHRAGPRAQSSRTRRRVPTRRMGWLTVFAVRQRIISHGHLASRRNPGPATVRRRNKQPNPGCSAAVSGCFVTSNKNPRHRPYRCKPIQCPA